MAGMYLPICRWLTLLGGLFLVACSADAAGGTAIVPTGSSRTPASGQVIVTVHGAKPSEKASAAVTALPHAQCTIVYRTPDGKTPRAAKLEPKTTDAQGRATWSWPIA